MKRECKICGGEAGFVFSRGEADGVIAETKVNPEGYERRYYQCGVCGLLFHNGFDGLDGRQYSLLPGADGKNLMGDGVEPTINRAIRELNIASCLISLFNLDPARLRTLVFGCGSGLSFNMFLQNGINAFGSDITLFFQRKMPFPPGLFKPELVPEMLKRFIKTDRLTGERFDLIAMTEVFEHFTEPLDEMARLVELLAPKGILYGTTGMADRVASGHKEWWYLQCLTHATFLTRKSFAVLCAKLGVSGLIFPNSGQFVGAAKMSDEQGIFVIQRP